MWKLFSELYVMADKKSTHSISRIQSSSSWDRLKEKARKRSHRNYINECSAPKTMPLPTFSLINYNILTPHKYLLPLSLSSAESKTRFLDIALAKNLTNFQKQMITAAKEKNPADSIQSEGSAREQRM